MCVNVINLIQDSHLIHKQINKQIHIYICQLKNIIFLSIKFLIFNFQFPTSDTLGTHTDQKIYIYIIWMKAKQKTTTTKEWINYDLIA